VKRNWRASPPLLGRQHAVNTARESQYSNAGIVISFRNSYIRFQEDRRSGTDGMSALPLGPEPPQLRRANVAISRHAEEPSRSLPRCCRFAGGTGLSRIAATTQKTAGRAAGTPPDAERRISAVAGPGEGDADTAPKYATPGSGGDCKAKASPPRVSRRYFRPSRSAVLWPHRRRPAHASKFPALAPVPVKYFQVY